MKFITFISLLVATTTVTQGRLGKKQSTEAPRSIDTIVPGSGYGCEANNKCDTNDEKCREYELVLEIKKFSIKNSAKFFNTSEDVEFVTRTYSAGSGHFNTEYLTSKCGTYSNDDNILGPCIEAVPGGSLYIKLINKFDENNISFPLLSNNGPTPEEYLQEINNYTNPNGIYSSLKDFPLLGRAPTNVTDLGVDYNVWHPGMEWNETIAKKALNKEWVRENTPGADVSFNASNLHLHGMEVVPHLFYPMGTSEGSSEWIDVRPKSELDEAHTSSCFNYNFTLPEAHPSGGTYWYHAHRHGSVAIQTWGGMASLVYVPGIAEKELEINYKVDNDLPFVIWDPHMVCTKREGQPDLCQVGPWLDNQNNYNVEVPFLVNNEYQPEFDVSTGEISRMRVLCATTENMCGFRIIKTAGYEDDIDNICNLGLTGETFWNIGSDGVMFNRAYAKNMLILGGGLREEILVRLNTHGRYAVCQQGLTDNQFFDTGPSNQTLAYINVADGALTGLAEQYLDMDTIRLTPGIPENDAIVAASIKRVKSLVFNMDGSMGNMPFPHFNINSANYVEKSISETFEIGNAVEMQIFNKQKTIHPFHIHVNSFQVVDITTSYKPGSEFSQYLADQALVPNNRWRDTLLIPPMSSITIWYRPYNAYVGKTVFHCHFLAHEDTGMIQNFLIKYNSTICDEANNDWVGSCDVANHETVNYGRRLVKGHDKPVSFSPITVI